MYQKDDYIIVIHPDYSEFQGLAKITSNIVNEIVNIDFCDGSGSFLAHTEFIRKATEIEIKNGLHKQQK